MRICITLDDVLRDKSKRVVEIYKKYIDKDFDNENVVFTTNDYYKLLKFDSRQAYNKFLYDDYVFEIFAESPTCTPMLDKQLNLWLLNVNEDDDIDEDIEVFLGNAKEFNISIGFTHFFLSQMATRVRETQFPKDSSTLWNKSDVIITAEPYILETKPEGKIVVKIETDYNKEYDADFTYDSLKSVLDDEEFIKNLIKYNGTE